MTPLESVLWDRILGFCLDHRETAFSFAARLVQDNGWELLYTLRVLHECRRFAFLLGVATPVADVFRRGQDTSFTSVGGGCDGI